MKQNAPSPVIQSARVISYAFVDDIPYRRWGSLYSGDRLIEHVPQLAICLNLGKDIGPLLFHCDEEWNVLGVSGGATIEEAKGRAARNYPGVESRWVDVNTSIDEAIRYYDRETNGAKCSFCGKRPFEIADGWVEGNNAIICRTCVEDFNEEFKNDSSTGNRG
jgi:hypothetical protein